MNSKILGLSKGKMKPIIELPNQLKCVLLMSFFLIVKKYYLFLNYEIEWSLEIDPHVNGQLTLGIATEELYVENISILTNLAESVIHVKKVKFNSFVVVVQSLSHV